MDNLKFICCGAAFYILTILIPLKTNAAEMTALQLQQACAETEKGFLGKPFDAGKSESCRGYMMGFFDSMIVTEQLLKKPEFCIPASLPKSYNTTILDNWVNENQKIADSTTAAVALYAAYKKAFACK